jgi:hypothetical protein
MFKYFNPIWIIKNFLQPSLGPEILVPAAIGAVGSGVMGGNPIKGALLGAATGGILGGAGGAGGNLFSGFKSALPSATGTGVQLGSTALNPALALDVVDDVALNQAFNQSLNTALPTSVTGGGGAAINFKDIGTTFGGTNLPAGGAGISIAPYTNIPVDKFGQVNPLGLDPRRMAVDTPLTFGERLSDLGSNTMSYAQQNPMTVLSGGQSLLDIRQKNEQADKQRLQEAVAMGNQQIRKGQSGPMAGNLLQVKRIG